MVRSNLNDAINYKENRGLEKVDMVDHDAPLYEIEMYGVTIKIATGKINRTHESFGVYYIPIYIILKKKVKMQIGVYEIEKDMLDELTDEEGDVKIEDLTPLLYSFVTSKPGMLKIFRVEEDVSEEEEDEEEEKEESDTVKDEAIIKESSDTWVKKYMDNQKYRLIGTLPNGDCFFLALVKSLRTKDIHVSVKKLRAQLADEVTQEIYQSYKERFDDLSKELKSLLAQGLELKKISSENKKNAERFKNNREELMKIMKKHEKDKAKYAEVKKNKTITDELYKEVRFMNNVSSIEDLKDKIKTLDYWADNFAVSTMERILNVKFIILSGDNYEENDLDNVVTCTESDKQLEQQGTFLPDNYIILENKGNHYRAIFIEDQGAFTYDELEESLKEKIIDKCLDNEKSSFYLIPEFKAIYDKKKTTTDILKENESTMESKKAESSLNVDIESSKNYDENIEFILGDSANTKPYPGKGNKEKIVLETQSDFKELHGMSQWRRRLADDYMEEFAHDGKTWPSVTHLFEALKFKDTHNNFYQMFTKESGTEIIKSASNAKIAGSNKGSKGSIILRPKDIRLEDEYREENLNAKSFIPILEEAQMAKFSNNDELKDMLLSTKDAKLVLGGRGKKEKRICHELMSVRDKLKKM